MVKPSIFKKNLYFTFSLISLIFPQLKNTLLPLYVNGLQESVDFSAEFLKLWEQP